MLDWQRRNLIQGLCLIVAFRAATLALIGEVLYDQAGSR